MKEPLREFEGTWEEVAAHEAELRGHHVKLTVVDSKTEQETIASETELPRGSYARIAEGLRQHPLDSKAEPDLWEIVAEERAAWRKMAQETTE